MTSCVIFLAVRASRLLQILLLLQNRGRLTTAALASELEVAQRTIIRDVEALTEAGLPIVVHRGARGGIELGFNYRTRLTGLAADEAEALGVMLARPHGALASLGLADAATRARRKLVESLPDTVREKAAQSERRFRFSAAPPDEPDPRLPALADAIRQRRVVRINAPGPDERVVHPIGLVFGADGWSLEDEQASGALIPLRACGNINISSRTFPVPGAQAAEATSPGAPAAARRPRRRSSTRPRSQ